MPRVRRWSGQVVRAVAGGTVLLASIGLAAPPATAIGGCAITGQSNVGFVGQPQVLSVSNCNASNNVVATFLNGASQLVPILQVAGNAAQATWVPSQVGAANLSLDSVTNPSGILASSTIQQVPTTTSISAPNTAQIGVPTTITVLVQSQSPSSYQPTGQVVVRDGNGATVVSMGLTPSANANGQAFAYWRWTPPSAGTFLFQATYNGDANARTSVSPFDLVAATPSGNTISLTAPGTLTVGVPALLTATVVPNTVQGSVGFTLNGAPISASVPLVVGAASFLWTPTVAGAVTLGANYMTNGGRSGSTTDPVTIVPGPASPDVITLVQPGVGAWAPNGVYTLGNGTSFTFQARTLSGAAVTLTNTGPCNQSGLALVIDTGSGQCSLVATSPGGPGFAPVRQGYTVVMVPGQQTARLAAPASGRFAVGRSIRLENPSQGATNAGQNITWRITNGANRCRLRYPSSGAVNLQLQRAGQCTVVARAAAVPGQWASFRLQRTYTAR
jgi:hypothetical protein